MEQQDRVYGLHEFVAENADEVSFKVGETIRVVEKDDAYGDGWWQVSARARRKTTATPSSDIDRPVTPFPHARAPTKPARLVCFPFRTRPSTRTSP